PDCRPCANRHPSSPHPRAESPARPDPVDFLPPSICGPTTSAAAAESTTHGAAARRPTGPPRGLPRAAAGGAGGRDRGGGAGAPSALRAVVYDPAARRRGRVWRHQVVESLPLAVQVTEYQMEVRRCPLCGKRTRAELPPGVPRRPFGPRLTAVVALLSGRYRLSRREVRQLLQDLWQVKLSLGAVVHQEQAQSAALTAVVEEARAVVQEAAVVNVDETGWRQEQRRAWLWAVVTGTLAVFRIDRRRGGAVVEALLGADFGGVVGSDRWSAYRRFPAERRAVCYAHLKRDFQGLVDRGGEAEPIGRWGLAEI